MKLEVVPKTRGSALVLTLITVVVTGIGLASYLTLVSSHNTSVMRAQAWNQGISMLESGIEEALTQIHYNGITNFAVNGWVSTNGLFMKNRTIGDGYYQVGIQAVEPPVIYAKGYVPAPLSGSLNLGMILGEVLPFLQDDRSNEQYVSRRVKVTTERVGGSGGGLIAKNRIIFSGGGSLDSYDSSAGPYNPLNRKANAIAITNSKVADAIHVDTAHVYGAVTVGPGGTVTCNSGAVGDLAWNATTSGVQPMHAGNDANLDFSDVVVPFTSGYFTPGAGTVNGTNYTYVVGAGNNQLGTINIGGGKSMIVTGDATLYINGDFTTSGSGFVYINPGASLQLYIKGKGTVSGTGVVNGNQNPSKLSVYGLSTSTTKTWSGSSTFYGTVYAPYAAFTFSGSAGARGSFTANNVTISGGASVHYDESLGGQGNEYVVASWIEI